MCNLVLRRLGGLAFVLLLALAPASAAGRARFGRPCAAGRRAPAAGSQPRRTCAALRPPPAGQRPPLDIKEIALENGLKIYVLEKPTSPTFAALLPVRGGRSDGPEGAERNRAPARAHDVQGDENARRRGLREGREADGPDLGPVAPARRRARQAEGPVRQAGPGQDRRPAEGARDPDGRGQAVRGPERVRRGDGPGRRGRHERQHRQRRDPLLHPAPLEPPRVLVPHGVRPAPQPGVPRVLRRARGRPGGAPAAVRDLARGDDVRGPEGAPLRRPPVRDPRHRLARGPEAADRRGRDGVLHDLLLPVELHHGAGGRRESGRRRGAREEVPRPLEAADDPAPRGHGRSRPGGGAPARRGVRRRAPALDRLADRGRGGQGPVPPRAPREDPRRPGVLAPRPHARAEGEDRGLRLVRAELDALGRVLHGLGDAEGRPHAGRDRIRHRRARSRRSRRRA